MKKLLSVFIPVVLILFAAACGKDPAPSISPSDLDPANLTSADESTFGEAENTDGIFVTIAAEGEIVLGYQKLTPVDLDSDGDISVKEALISAHEQFFGGGAKEGFSTATGEWGEYISKLWGIENGGAYGYYIDDAPAMTLDDSVPVGSYLYACAYKDAANYSDVYTCFQELTRSDDSITLIVTMGVFEEDGSFGLSHLSGAKISVDGEETDLVTDEDGIVTVNINTGVSHTFTDSSDTLTIMPNIFVS